VCNARTEAPTPEATGKPALIWRAERDRHPSIECLASMTTDGRYRVWLVRNGIEQKASVWESEAAGIQWALDALRDLTDQGWTTTY
jgi:hypothetical protein